MKPTAFIKDWLLSLGARPSTTGMGIFRLPYQYVLDTSLGELHVSIYDDWVACRFDDVARARAVLPHGYSDRLNPHSGKWNHHYFGWPPGDTLSNFIWQINEVL